MNKYIKHLRKRGIEPRLEGWEEVILEVDDDYDIPEHIADIVREHKAEVVASLRAEQVKSFLYLLDSQSWVSVRSSVLNEVVVFVSTKTVEIPSHLRDAVIYTMAELPYLPGMDAETLRTCNEVKKLFGGTLVPERLDPRPDRFDRSGPVGLNCPLSQGSAVVSGRLEGLE